MIPLNELHLNIWSICAMEKQLRTSFFKHTFEKDLEETTVFSRVAPTVTMSYVVQGSVWAYFSIGFGWICLFPVASMTFSKS